MAHQTVTPVAAAAANYQKGITGASAKWSAGCQSYQGETPMALAAGQVTKAVANYGAYLNSGKWAQNLAALPMASWKGPTAANSPGAQKYAMAKGAAKWQTWYQNQGQTMAMQMQTEAAGQRQAGVPWQQRVVSALEIAVTFKGMK
jgi:hypothetical protein